MKILDITLPCHNMEGIHAFYTLQLGLECLHKEEEICTFALGYSRLVFKKAKAAISCHHFCIHVHAKAFAAVLEKFSHLDFLKNEEGEQHFSFPNWQAKSVYFYDPEGNIVEFITRESLPLAYDFPFIGIAEIGITGIDAMLLLKRLQDFTNLPLYFRQPKQTEEVAIMGDDEGLFICVRQSRKWYPTNFPAGFTQMECTIEHKGIKNYLRFYPEV
jgi:catechol 2,3-dioxygenase-like lactoylglutathione lyase family enzyme